MTVDNRNFYTLDDVYKNINLAQTLYFSGKFDEAYNLITRAAKTFEFLASIGLKGENLNKKEYESVFMLAGDICGELDKFDEALRYYKMHQFFNLQYNHDFRGQKSIELFQFRNTKFYSLKNLRNNEITLVDPRIQNDIVDCPIFSWLDSLCGQTCRYKKHIGAYKSSFDHIRATSFCMDTLTRKAIENTLMWAHYANCHKGICVQYELNEHDFSVNQMSSAFVLRLMRIRYANPNEEKDIIDFTNPETKLNIRTGLATKSIDWSYENEARMVAYAPTEQSKFVQYHLKSPNPIKAIYFGVKCPISRKNAVRDIFKDRPEVEFYQMITNPQNIHKLSYNPC